MYKDWLHTRQLKTAIHMDKYCARRTQSHQVDYALVRQSDKRVLLTWAPYRIGSYVWKL